MIIHNFLRLPECIAWFHPILTRVLSVSSRSRAFLAFLALFTSSLSPEEYSLLFLLFTLWFSKKGEDTLVMGVERKVKKERKKERHIPSPSNKQDRARERKRHSLQHTNAKGA